MYLSLSALNIFLSDKMGLPKTLGGSWFPQSIKSLRYMLLTQNLVVIYLSTRFSRKYSICLDQLVAFADVARLYKGINYVVYDISELILQQ